MAEQMPAVAESMHRGGPSTPGLQLAESYREFRAGLLGFLHSKVSNPSVAEDILQEVFLKALIALERGATPANLPAWLQRIATNTVIDFYRTRRQTVPVPDDLPAQEGVYAPSAEQTLALCLKPFINELPDIYRQAMLATAIEGRSLVAVSEDEGLTASAVKSRVSRGRRMLRQKVLDCCHVEVARSGEVLAYVKRD
ncbi:MAG: sigma-70 family RNA polymerase sigma factor [Marinobacter sp.]|uniref:sigma-70 family RNA polymerase sigma factor n=1 Tax=Marinobacter sp. TaxID=50741 RepID=UPI0034A04841